MITEFLSFFSSFCLWVNYAKLRLHFCLISNKVLTLSTAYTMSSNLSHSDLLPHVLVWKWVKVTCEISFACFRAVVQERKNWGISQSGCDSTKTREGPGPQWSGQGSLKIDSAGRGLLCRNSPHAFIHFSGCWDAEYVRCFSAWSMNWSSRRGLGDLLHRRATRAQAVEYTYSEISSVICLGRLWRSVYADSGSFRASMYPKHVETENVVRTWLIPLIHLSLESLWVSAQMAARFRFVPLRAALHVAP